MENKELEEKEVEQENGRKRKSGKTEQLNSKVFVFRGLVILYM